VVIIFLLLTGPLGEPESLSSNLKPALMRILIT
jgi:hypothetical protein